MSVWAWPAPPPRLGPQQLRLRRVARSLDPGVVHERADDRQAAAGALDRTLADLADLRRQADDLRCAAGADLEGVSVDLGREAAGDQRDLEVAVATLRAVAAVMAEVHLAADDVLADAAAARPPGVPAPAEPGAQRAESLHRSRLRAWVVGHDEREERASRWLAALDEALGSARATLAGLPASQDPVELGLRAASGHAGDASAASTSRTSVDASNGFVT